MNAFPRALRTPGFDIAILGYALFLVINACSLWGGVFPFFPSEFHGEEVTFSFMMAQSLTSLLTYIVVLVCSFQVPSIVIRSLHGVSSFPAFLGGVLLIAALYVPAWRIALVTAAGCCMGAGGTLLSLVWARYFSAETTDRGNFFILAGTFFAPILFALLYLVPQAVRVFLIPLVFVPLCGLSVLLSFRKLNKNLPIFQDAPRANIPVYVRIVHIYWKSAFAVGTMGFASGLVRSIAVADVQLGDATNAASFWGLFVAAGILLLLWQKRSFSLNVHLVFMMSFPLVAGCLAVFPFVEGNALAFISGVVFLLFSLANTIVMLQSAHICLNRGCNPFFVYGFFGAIIGFLQNSGFIFGHTAIANSIFGVRTSFAVAIIGLLVLTITLYAFVGRSERFTSNLPQYDNVEFVSFGASGKRPRRTWAQLLAPVADDASEPLDVEVLELNGAAARAASDEIANARVATERSKSCEASERSFVGTRALAPDSSTTSTNDMATDSVGAKRSESCAASERSFVPTLTYGEATSAENNLASAPAPDRSTASTRVSTDCSEGCEASERSLADDSAPNTPAPTRNSKANDKPSDLMALLGDLYHSPEKAPSRIALRCKILQEQYRLTSRETEIMELIVRGYSVARIAEEHVVSENTVRTHYKHIYAKLGVHKKAELIAMVDALKDIV